MIPFRLLLILHGFVISMHCKACQEYLCFCDILPFVLRKQTVSACVNLNPGPRNGTGSRMARIHVHSSNLSNPDSPPFSQPALCLVVGALLGALLEADLKLVFISSCSPPF